MTRSAREWGAGKQTAPAVLYHPEARTTKGVYFMAKESIHPPPIHLAKRMNVVLGKAQYRYRNEIMDDEERMELEDKIKWLERSIGSLLREARTT